MYARLYRATATSLLYRPLPSLCLAAASYLPRAYPASASPHPVSARVSSTYRDGCALPASTRACLSLQVSATRLPVSARVCRVCPCLPRIQWTASSNFDAASSCNLAASTRPRARSCTPTTLDARLTLSAGDSRREQAVVISELLRAFPPCSACLIHAARFIWAASHTLPSSRTTTP